MFQYIKGVGKLQMSHSDSTRRFLDHEFLFWCRASLAPKQAILPKDDLDDRIIFIPNSCSNYVIAWHRLCNTQ